MFIAKLDLPKNWDSKECEKLIIQFSKQYVRYFLADLRHNEDEIKRLTQVSNWVKLYIYHDSDISSISYIRHILYSILDKAYIYNGAIYIIGASYNRSQSIKRQYNGIDAEKLYKLITFGNLELPRSKILDEAIKFGVKRMVVKKKYGY